MGSNGHAVNGHAGRVARFRQSSFDAPDAARFADQMVRETEAERRPLIAPAFRAARDLVETFPALRPPVVHGLLRQGETMNVIAAPKTGKSWLALDLALSVATGRPWLGFPVTPGDVLIIDNELHGETMASRIPAVAEARAISVEEYGERLFVENLRCRLVDIFALETYFDQIEPGRFALIILDAFYRLQPAGADENSNAAMARVYNQVDRFAERTGAAFVLIHHSSKGNQADKATTDVGSGAGAMSRAADTHLVMRAHEEDGCVVVDAVARSWPPVAPLPLRWRFPTFNADGELNPAALRRPVSAGDARQSSKDREGVELIRGALAQYGPLSSGGLRSRVGMGADRVNRLLRLMIEAGDVSSEDTEVGGNMTIVYCLNG